QRALRRPGNRGVVRLALVANRNGARLALRFGQLAPAGERMPWIAIAAHRPRRVNAQELAARRHAVDPPAGAREIRDLVRFRAWDLVDVTEEVALGAFPSRFDLEVERDGNKVLLDDLEIRVAEEPGPGSNTGASRPPQRVAIAYPDQEGLALRRRLLARLP